MGFHPNSPVLKAGIEEYFRRHPRHFFRMVFMGLFLLGLMAFGTFEGSDVSREELQICEGAYVGLETLRGGKGDEVSSWRLNLADGNSFRITTVQNFDDDAFLQAVRPGDELTVLWQASGEQRVMWEIRRGDETIHAYEDTRAAHSENERIAMYLLGVLAAIFLLCWVKFRDDFR